MRRIELVAWRDAGDEINRDQVGTLVKQLEYGVLCTTIWSGLDYVWIWSRRALRKRGR